MLVVAKLSGYSASICENKSLVCGHSKRSHAHLTHMLCGRKPTGVRSTRLVKTSFVTLEHRKEQGVIPGLNLPLFCKNYCCGLIHCAGVLGTAITQKHSSGLSNSVIFDFELTGGMYLVGGRARRAANLSVARDRPLHGAQRRRVGAQVSARLPHRRHQPHCLPGRRGTQHFSVMQLTTCYRA